MKKRVTPASSTRLRELNKDPKITPQQAMRIAARERNKKKAMTPAPSYGGEGLTLSENIARLIRAGYPRDQAIAIAYAESGDKEDIIFSVQPAPVE